VARLAALTKLLLALVLVCGALALATGFGGDDTAGQVKVAVRAGSGADGASDAASLLAPLCAEGTPFFADDHLSGDAVDYALPSAQRCTVGADEVLAQVYARPGDLAVAMARGHVSLNLCGTVGGDVGALAAVVGANWVAATTGSRGPLRFALGMAAAPTSLDCRSAG